MALRPDASDVEGAALDEECFATRGNLRDSESMEDDSDTGDISHSETVGFFEEALEQMERADPRRGTRARIVQQFFGEGRSQLAVTEGNYMELKKVYEAKQGDDWDQRQLAMKDEGNALQDNKTWKPVDHPQTGMSYVANGSTK